MLVEWSIRVEVVPVREEEKAAPVPIMGVDGGDGSELLRTRTPGNLRQHVKCSSYVAGRWYSYESDCNAHQNPSSISFESYVGGWMGKESPSTFALIVA